MLDLIIGHRGKCEKCGHDRECARVNFWDGSFTGLICWIDLMKLVNELSKDPECRKKFADARAAKEAKPAQLPPDYSWTETRTTTRATGRSVTRGRSEGWSHSEGISHSQTEGRSYGASETRGDGDTKQS